MKIALALQSVGLRILRIRYPLVNHLPVKGIMFQSLTCPRRPCQVTTRALRGQVYMGYMVTEGSWWTTALWRAMSHFTNSSLQQIKQQSKDSHRHRSSRTNIIRPYRQTNVKNSQFILLLGNQVCGLLTINVSDVWHMNWAVEDRPKVTVTSKWCILSL